MADAGHSRHGASAVSTTESALLRIAESLETFVQHNAKPADDERGYEDERAAALILKSLITGQRVTWSHLADQVGVPRQYLYDAKKMPITAMARKWINAAGFLRSGYRTTAGQVEAATWDERDLE